jgi:hypothetical protein
VLAGELHAHRMSRLAVSVLTSLDGDFQGRDGDLNLMPLKDAVKTHNLGLLRTASAFTCGATWFTENWDFWSTVAGNTSANEREHDIAFLALNAPSTSVLGPVFFAIYAAETPSNRSWWNASTPSRFRALGQLLDEPTAGECGGPWRRDKELRSKDRHHHWAHPMVFLRPRRQTPSAVMR